MRASTKSVLFFMVVYLGSLSLLASGIAYLYYMDQKKSLIDQLRLEMRYKVKSINSKLEYYHLNQDEEFTFYEEGYGIALYDNKRELIVSTFHDETIDFSQFFYGNDEEYYLVESLHKEYLDVKYIVTKKALDPHNLESIKERIALIALYAFPFLILVALILSKIMLSPINRSISNLRKFMKDATHEMNTPISTILMSFEHMDKKNLNTKQLRSLDRIDIATKTLSGLYNDLSFASFHDYIHAQNVETVSLEVYEELKRKEYKDIETITSEQVRVTAWWHDCYKASRGTTKSTIRGDCQNPGKDRIRIGGPD